MRTNTAADAKHLRRLGLFEFYRAGGLRSEVVQDAVHTRHLMRDAVHEVAHEVERDVLDGGAHGVGGVHGADDDRPLESALAVLHAGGLEVGHDGKILPDLALKAVLCKLLAEDRVGLADGFETVARDGAGAADAEAGAGERLTEHHAVGQAELLADNAHFVLEEDLHRLDELELHILRETARIVVRLENLEVLQLLV